MVPDSYLGQPFFLINDQPNWVKGVRADVDVVADLTKSLSNREARRAFAATLRFSFSYQATVTHRRARATADALRDYQTQPVALPFWPGMVKWPDRYSMPINGGLKILFREDFDQWQVYEGIEPVWATNSDFVCPLLWGRLDKRELVWQDTSSAFFDVQFIEQSKPEWALTPVAQVWTNGPLPGDAYDAPPKVLPFGMDFNAPRTGFNVSIIREQIGFGRTPQETLYAQTNARTHEGSSTLLSTGDVGNVLRFFMEYGPARIFWASNTFSAAVLTADIPAATTVLNVEDTYAIRPGDFLAFLYASGVQATARVASKTGNTITVDVAPGALKRGLTTVAQLLLARFDKTRLSLAWSEPGLAGVTLPVVEVPPEYAPAADEDIGTTVGELPARCYLYDFSRTLNGVVFTDRFTSYEGTLSLGSIGGNAYTSQKLSHKEIRQGLQLDADEVTIDASIWTASPLLLIATLKSEAPLYLTIREAQVSGSLAINAATIFTGEVTAVSVKGSILTAKATPGGTIFDRRVPRVIFQRTCNNALFDAGCTLAKADWKFTAKVSGVGSPGYPFEFDLSNLDRAVGSDPTYSANYFAGGWLEAGDGLNWQRRAVILSTNPVAGALTVTLDRDPAPFLAVNDNVILYPGCDLQRLTCIQKFNNYLNFIGHPYLPLANPSLVKRDQTSAGGKK